MFPFYLNLLTCYKTVTVNMGQMTDWQYVGQKPDRKVCMSEAEETVNFTFVWETAK